MQTQVMGQLGQLAKSPMGEAMTQQMIPNDGTDEEAGPPPSPQG